MRFLRHLGTSVAMAGLLPCLLYSQPVLSVVGGSAFTFGDITSNSAVQKIVTLANRGSDTLVVDDVLAICGCTGTLLSSDHIAPGDSGSLSISFDPSAFSGHVEKHVSLHTNDPAHGRIDITFTANVVKALVIDPPYLFVKTIVDSATTAPISLFNSSSKDIRILSVKSTSDLISVKLEDRKIAPGKETSIVTTVTPRRSGMISGNIEFTTDHPLQPMLTIRYMAWVKADHAMNPPSHD